MRRIVVGLAIATSGALVAFWMYKTRSDVSFALFAFGVLCAFEAYQPDYLSVASRSGVSEARLEWARAHPLMYRSIWLPVSASLLIGSLLSPLSGKWNPIVYLGTGLAALVCWGAIALQPLSGRLSSLATNVVVERLMRRLGPSALGAFARGTGCGLLGAVVAVGINRHWPQSIQDWTAPLATLIGFVWLFLGAWAGSLGEYARTGKLELGAGFLPDRGGELNS